MPNQEKDRVHNQEKGAAIGIGSCNSDVEYNLPLRHHSRVPSCMCPQKKSHDQQMVFVKGNGPCLKVSPRAEPTCHEPSPGQFVICNSTILSLVNLRPMTSPCESSFFVPCLVLAVHPTTCFVCLVRPFQITVVEAVDDKELQEIVQRLLHLMPATWHSLRTLLSTLNSPPTPTTGSLTR